MATFKLRRFSNPDILKQVEPGRLTRFLLPHRNYLSARGVALHLPVIDYEKLASVLMSPEEGLPIEIVNALFMVDAMADEDAMEHLLDTAQKREIVLDLGDDPTPADVAIELWLTARALLEEAHAEAAVHRVKRFEYYSGARRRRREFPTCSPEQLVQISERLRLWFTDKKKGAIARVFLFEARDKLHIAIRHGSAMRREGSITDGKSTAAFFRPEIHDVLAYDRGMDVLGLKAGSVGERTVYRQVIGEIRQVIGEILFGSAGYFDAPFSITLEPVFQKGPEVLNCEDVPGMASAKLVEICRSLGGAYKERQIAQATDLFGAMRDKWRSRLNSRHLTSVKFEVRLGEGSGQRPRKVTLAKPNHAKFDRDDEEAEIIETWLRRRGFLPEPVEDTRHDTLALPVVASPNGTPAAVDGPPGLATSSGE
jgi:hypothetical protein